MMAVQRSKHVQIPVFASSEKAGTMISTGDENSEFEQHLSPPILDSRFSILDSFRAFGAFTSDFSKSSKEDNTGLVRGWTGFPSNAYFMTLTYTADAIPKIYTQTATAVPLESRTLAIW